MWLEAVNKVEKVPALIDIGTKVKPPLISSQGRRESDVTERLNSSNQLIALVCTTPWESLSGLGCIEFHNLKD